MSYDQSSYPEDQWDPMYDESKPASETLTLSVPVCLTCKRLANWPFCEHRTADGDWFVYVTVRGRMPREPR